MCKEVNYTPNKSVVLAIAFYFVIGKACRTKVTVSMLNKFHTPKEAIDHYDRLTGATLSASHSGVPLTQSSPLQGCKNLLRGLNSQEQLHIISVLYSEFINSQEHPSSAPADFLELAFSAVCHLHDCGRSDIIYLMAKGLGTMRLDKSDSLFPAKRMPTGLIEYAAKIFTAHSVQQVILSSPMLINY